jgi:hypothetical protein
MKTLLSVLALFIVLIVAVWAVVMGGIGALLGPLRGRSRTSAFLIGLFFGPFGWLFLLTKAHRPFAVTSAPKPGLADKGWPPETGPGTQAAGDELPLP